VEVLSEVDGEVGAVGCMRRCDVEMLMSMHCCAAMWRWRTVDGRGLISIGIGCIDIATAAAPGKARPNHEAKGTQGAAKYLVVTISNTTRLFSSITYATFLFKI
jgi:hypothetical protein